MFFSDKINSHSYHKVTPFHVSVTSRSDLTIIVKSSFQTQSQNPRQELPTSPFDYQGHHQDGFRKLFQTEEA